MVEAPPPPPLHRAPLVVERTGDGWRTPHLAFRSGNGCYVDIMREGRKQTVYLCASDLDRLTRLASSTETGSLWRIFSAIPLERPLPSRELAEELRLILCARVGVR